MRRIILLSLGLLILFSLQPDIQASDEKEHPDITPLIEALKYPDENFRVAVVRALSNAGEDALPVLIPLIVDEYNKVQFAAIRSVGRFQRKAEAAHDNLVEALGDDDIYVRLHAASTLSQVGPYGKEAVPTLIECLENEDSWQGMAIDILGDIGSEASDALPYLVEITRLVDTNPALASHAVYAIGYIGQDAEELEEYILPFLRSDRYDNTRAAINALRRLGSKSPVFVNFLIEELVDNNGYSSYYLQILGDIGPPAADAIPVIKAIFEDSNADSWLQYKAIETLARIGTGREIADILMHYADDYPRPVRCMAIKSLGKLRPTPDGLVDTLMDMLPKEPDREIRKSICIALGDIGPEAKEVVPILMENVLPKLRGSHPGMWAVEALGNIGPDAEDATPILIESLEYTYRYALVYSDNWHQDFIETVFVLGDIGPGAIDALPILREYLDSDHLRWHPAIHYAIAGINGDVANAVPHLIAIIEDEEKGGCNGSVMEVISRLGPLAADAVDILVGELWGMHPMYRRLLVETLGAIGPAAAPALDDLRIIARVYPDDAIDKRNIYRDKTLDAIAKIEGRW